MKAFLLAAGHGTRLRPITDSIPKCLVPIRGVPLLKIWLQVCARSGIDEVLINLHSNADTVRHALRDELMPVKVRVVDEEVLLGSAGTVYANRDWVKGEAAFWILYADVLTTSDLRSMADFHQSRRPLATLGLYQAPNPKGCGIAVCDADGVIQDFEEKPKNPRSSWAFSGLMLASSMILEIGPKHHPADIAFDLLPRLVGKMLGYPIHDYLCDIGTIENYQQAQTTWPGLEAVCGEKTE
ncbi:MAG TPA: nucleotidyltransferase family protein [Terriglobales bacterium]|nr:nucleotidyltransferase family protein [Terriglobales bacterium]